MGCGERVIQEGQEYLVPKNRGNRGAQALLVQGDCCDTSDPISAAPDNPRLCCGPLSQYPAQLVMAKGLEKDGPGG